MRSSSSFTRTTCSSYRQPAYSHAGSELGQLLFRKYYLLPDDAFMVFRRSPSAPVAVIVKVQIVAPPRLRKRSETRFSILPFLPSRDCYSDRALKTLSWFPLIRSRTGSFSRQLITLLWLGAHYLSFPSYVSHKSIFVVERDPSGLLPSRPRDRGPYPPWDFACVSRFFPVRLSPPPFH